MSEWMTPNGRASTTSNLAPDNVPFGAKAETSSHIEIQQRGDETIHIDNTSREYTADPSQMDESAGIMSTARTESGGFIMSRSVGAKDLVSIPGFGPTRVEVAAHLGYLTRNPDGSYTETQKATSVTAAETAKTAAAKAEAKADTPATFTIGDEGEAVMTEIVQSFQPGVTIAAMDEILQRGEISTDRLSQLASQAGLEPGQVAEKFGAAHAAFHEAASAHLEGLGVVDDDAFEAFINENPEARRNLGKAARDLVVSNSTQGLDAVADAFLEKADRYMADDVKAALEEAGYGHQTDGLGGLLVVLNSGAQVPFNVAVRQKIITFTR